MDKLFQLATLLCVAPTRAMFDAVFPLMSSPSECAHGCALWSDLAADGNTRDQSAVNAKVFPKDSSDFVHKIFI